MKTFSFVVSVTINDETIDGGVGSRRVEEYIRDAVKTWGGSFMPPSDPLAGDSGGDGLHTSNIGKITVRPIREDSR